MSDQGSTTAILDRLLHRVVVIQMDGENYRMPKCPFVLDGYSSSLNEVIFSKMLKIHWRIKIKKKSNSLSPSLKKQ